MYGLESISNITHLTEDKFNDEVNDKEDTMDNLSEGKKRILRNNG